MRTKQIFRAFLMFAVLIVCIITPVKQQKVSYKGFKVLRIRPLNEKHLKVLERLYNDPNYQLDFLSESGTKHVVDVEIPPTNCSDVINILKEASIPYDVKITDIQRLINEEMNANGKKIKRINRRKRSIEIEDEDMFYLYNIVGTYARHDQINQWLAYATALKPPQVQVIDIGRSTEGRTLRVIKISSGKEGRPAVWMDGGMHAREWISPATAIFVIYMLITNYGSDPVIDKMVNSFDWYILPVANPDGYEYTFTTDRLWRKSRSNSSRNGCRGVDLNRNWNYHWLDCSEVHSFMSRSCASRYPCSKTYAGPRPLSEPENKAIADFILSKRKQWKLYMSLHSYSQIWLTNWGFTRTHPQDHNDVMQAARRGVEAIRHINGLRFKIGSPAHVLYPAAGGSFDWAKGVAGIKYAYTVELRDRGRYGFLLPPSAIWPSGQEILAALSATTEYISNQNS